MFGATITSAYRDPARNAAAGGAPGSSHMKGSPANPGAHDFVPASTELLNEALKMGAKWVDNHDYGSGYHSHVSWFREGGMYGGLPFVGSFEQGGVIPRDGMAYVHDGETVIPKGGQTVRVIFEGVPIEIQRLVRVEIEQDDRRTNAAYQAGRTA